MPSAANQAWAPGYAPQGQQGGGPGYPAPGQQAGGPGYPAPGQQGGPGQPQSSKPKKPIYKRVWFWILVVIAVIVIANLAGGGDDDTTADAGDSTTTAQDATDSADTTDPADTTDEPVDNAEEAEEGTNAVIGEPVTVDDWEVTVVALGEPVEAVGPDMFNTEAQGIFVPVQLKVTNNASQAEYFFADDFVLVDDQGREFSYSSDATIYGASDGAVSLLDEINPGNSLEGTLYYDVPVDATIVAMQVSGGLFTAPVTIALS
jgi:hypothetical protein